MHLLSFDKKFMDKFTKKDFFLFYLRDFFLFYLRDSYHNTEKLSVFFLNKNIQYNIYRIQWNT